MKTRNDQSVGSIPNRRRLMGSGVALAGTLWVNGISSAAINGTQRQLLPRDLSISDQTNAPDLSKADLACVPLAAAGEVDLVASWLSASATTDMSQCTLNLPLRDAYLQETPWLSRAIAAYATIRPNVESAERQRLDKWFLSNAEFNRVHIDYNMAKIFPRREVGNYTIKERDAKSGAMTGKRLREFGPPISVLSQWYNNRRASTILFVLQAGLMFEQEVMIRSSKRYIEEWLKYSVWEGGEQGEWLRNGDYGYVTAGLCYGASNIAIALLAAMWLEQKGDADLVRLETAEGLFGTESPKRPKTIWTAFNTHVALLDGSLLMKDQFGRSFDPLLTPYGRPNHPSWYLPAARHYLRDQSLNAWAAGSAEAPKLDDPFGKWRGMSGIFVDVRDV